MQKKKKKYEQQSETPASSSIEKIIESIKKTIIFQQALTHTSYCHENNSAVSYERLEFLGDSILNFNVALFIYRNFPNFDEGKMSKLRQSMVKESTLAQLSKEIGLNKKNKQNKLEYLRLGEGESKNQGANKDSILSDIFESFIAALYLEKGTRAVKKFLNLTLFNWIKGREEEVWDYKTQLQEFCQKRNKRIFYQVIKWRDPTKNQPFVVKAYDSLGEICAEGQGESMKVAEQEAARHALEKLGEIAALTKRSEKKMKDSFQQ